MLEKFSNQGSDLIVTFVESVPVKPGVTCDVYIHPETGERDLGIITIEPGEKTPLQKVLEGELTIEGYLSGEGTLTITHVDGTTSVMKVDSSAEGFCYSVGLGECMQWEAGPNQQLVVFEICFPPYKEGRYQDIAE